MVDKFVDLHTHTTASDGTLSPTDLVLLAKEGGLSAVAVTDHDTIDGVEDAISTGKENGIEVITGVEISAEPTSGTLHILGYGFDHKEANLNRILNDLVNSRNQRNGKIIKKFHDEGVDITLEEVESVAGGDVVGRPHFAKILLDKGYVRNKQEAFDVYLGKNGKCYMDKDRLSLEDSIKLIKGAGGVVVVAHPCTLGYKNEKELKDYLVSIKDVGIDGVEAFYPEHSAKHTLFLKKAAEDMGLLITGGSDFHGDNTPHLSLGKGTGSLKVPYSCFENLKRRTQPE